MSCGFLWFSSILCICKNSVFFYFRKYILYSYIHTRKLLDMFVYWTEFLCFDCWLFLPLWSQCNNFAQRLEKNFNLAQTLLFQWRSCRLRMRQEDVIGPKYLKVLKNTTKHPKVSQSSSKGRSCLLQMREWCTWANNVNRERNDSWGNLIILPIPTLRMFSLSVVFLPNVVVQQCKYNNPIT